MKKNFILFLLVFVAQKTFAQYNFENYNFLLDSVGKNYFKGTPGVAGEYVFDFNNLIMRGYNDTSAWGDFWTGWSISRLKDSISIDYDTNDCAAIPAIGGNNSNVYAVAYYNTFDPTYNHIVLKNIWANLFTFQITNTTITYRSMQNGDAFAKKFGGPTGNDPDYLRVKFYFWNNNFIGDSNTVYLADFRDSVNANDYIIKNWTTVVLPTPILTDSITYIMESSDTSAWGINTPTYFCIDNFTLLPESVQSISNNSLVKIYPNPVVNECILLNSSNENITFTVTDLYGKMMYQSNLKANEQFKLNTTVWATGMCILKLNTDKGIYYDKIIKK